MNNIAILYVTFERPQLMKKTLSSLAKYSKNNLILIGDQSSDKIKLENDLNFLSIQYCVNHCDLKYYKLPYDCGLSYSRNFLVKKARELSYKYCLIMSDSMEFTEQYDFQPIIDFMEADPRRGIVGFKLANRIDWHSDLNLIEGKYFEFDAPKRTPTIYNGIEFIPCDCVKNFFLAKTECLIHNPWLDELKMAEHESFFWELKNNPKDFSGEFGSEIFQVYQVFYIDYIVANYIDDKPPQYKVMRDRLYNKFLRKLKIKYNITGWHSYTSDFKELIYKSKLDISNNL